MTCGLHCGEKCIWYIDQNQWEKQLLKRPHQWDFLTDTIKIKHKMKNLSLVKFIIHDKCETEHHQWQKFVSWVGFCLIMCKHCSIYSWYESMIYLSFLRLNSRVWTDMTGCGKGRHSLKIIGLKFYNTTLWNGTLNKIIELINKVASELSFVPWDFIRVHLFEWRAQNISHFHDHLGLDWFLFWFETVLVGSLSSKCERF